MIFAIFLFCILLSTYITPVHFPQKHHTNQLTKYCVPEVQDHWSFTVDQYELYSRSDYLKEFSGFASIILLSCAYLCCGEGYRIS